MHYPHPLAQKIADRYAAVHTVEAVVLGGSLVTGMAQLESDIDLYVYSHTDLPINTRAEIASIESEQVEVNNRFWESGDEWIDALSGIKIDVMFRHTRWIEGELDRVLVRHEASVGYSTSIWDNVRHAEVLFDRNGWYTGLQQTADQPYPEKLRRHIFEKNYPILRDVHGAYRKQIIHALHRDDPVSVQHRITALLASYFDLLFAANRVTHPGEKRLLVFAQQRCALLPPDMATDVRGLIVAPMDTDLLTRIDTLIDGLDVVLVAAGLLTTE